MCREKGYTPKEEPRAPHGISITYQSPPLSVRDGVVGVLLPAAADANVLGAISRGQAASFQVRKLAKGRYPVK